MMFVIATQFLARSMPGGVQFRDVSKITLQCLSSICINLFTQLLSVLQEKRLKYRFVHMTCMQELNLVSQRTGNTSRVLKTQIAHQRCCGFVSCMNGRKKQRILQSFSKRYVLIWDHLRYLFSRRRGVLWLCLGVQHRLTSPSLSILMWVFDVPGRR